ncbi:MAG: TonB-dependent receptor [Candidatus Eremiobacteraeota bacterium]|nr:TonB-dependent receptor [Candidatus Eremiobacteraeota bacterium]
MLAALVFSVALAPTPSPGPSAKPARKYARAYKTIGHVTSRGRNQNLVGKVAAASVGTIDQEQIKTRPFLRPGEILEAIPSLLISQHSGEGKANQYYLRGFQLDHGTDLESTIAGTPINLPTHAHGQGYSDINWLIPELVSYVDYQKGPYYAPTGDFSTAGAYTLYYKNTLNAPITEFGLGTYGYSSMLVAASPRAGAGNILYAFQLYHDNGSFQRPDEYAKYNAVLKWSQSTENSDFSVTAMGYHGTFQSSDQIPQRLVSDGTLSPYGLIDPWDGGTTSRYSLASQWQRTDPNGVTQVNAFGFQQYLNLFSDFTYYLDDATDYYNVTRNPITCVAGYTTCNPGPTHVPAYISYCPANDVPGASRAPAHSVTPVSFVFACGDQREQLDRRFVSGINASRTFASAGNVTTTAGVGVRNDNIPTVGLFLVHDQIPYPDGTLSLAHVVERDAYAWVQSLIRVGSRLQLTPGLRADQYGINVGDSVSADSGRVNSGIVSPKFTAGYTLSPHQELYADWGESFHSNDARGVTDTLDPQTQAPYNALGQSVLQNTPLVRAVGLEFGFRYSRGGLNSTISLWQLHLNSELVFDGDAGVTSAGGPTMRRGIEFANFYQPRPWLTFDADIATSNARFLNNPEGLGTYVPESINVVTAAGITVDKPDFAASLRLRYFGPRVLDQAGDAVSAASVTYNAQGTWKTHRGYDLVADVFNIFNAQTNDVEYYYQSWLPQDAANPAFAKNAAVNPALGGAGVNDYVFHPGEKRTLRVTWVLHM